MKKQFIPKKGGSRTVDPKKKPSEKDQKSTSKEK